MKNKTKEKIINFIKKILNFKKENKFIISPVIQEKKINRLMVEFRITPNLESMNLSENDLYKIIEKEIIQKIAEKLIMNKIVDLKFIGDYDMFGKFKLAKAELKYIQ